MIDPLGAPTKRNSKVGWAHAVELYFLQRTRNHSGNHYSTGQTQPNTLRSQTLPSLKLQQPHVPIYIPPHRVRPYLCPYHDLARDHILDQCVSPELEFAEDAEQRVKVTGVASLGLEGDMWAAKWRISGAGGVTDGEDGGKVRGSEGGKDGVGGLGVCMVDGLECGR